MCLKSVLTLLTFIIINTNSQKLNEEKISQVIEQQQQEEDISQIIESELPENKKPGKSNSGNITVESCGLNHLNDISVGNKIVGGNEARIGQFPYQVMLMIWTTFLPQPMLCGGSIINKYWVLTAAHCVTYEGNDMHSILKVEVFAGLHNKKMLRSRVQNRSVDCIIRHENWKGFMGGLANDIALLRIQKDNPIIINHREGGFVNGVCLPPKQ